MMYKKIKLPVILILLFFTYNDCFPSNKTDDLIKFKRPVPDEVELIQKYGLNTSEDKSFFMSTVYKYSPQSNIDTEKIIINGMSSGVVIETWIDKPYGYIPKQWYDFFSKEDIDNNTRKKDGGLIIDYGIHDFGNGDVGRLIVKISNIIPLVGKNDKIDQDTTIARFAKFETFGYNPMVSIEISLIDDTKQKLIAYLGLLPNK